MIRTLDDLLDRAIKTVLTGDGTLVGRRALTLKKRLGFTSEKIPTLEECGRELNLTRERVRQLERRVLIDLPYSASRLDQTSLDTAIDGMHNAKNLGEVGSSVFACGAATSDNWDIDKIIKFASLLGRHDALLRISDLKRQIVGANDEIIDLVRRMREVSDQVGFLTVDVLYQEYSWLRKKSGYEITSLLTNHFNPVVIVGDVIFIPRTSDNSGFRAVREQLEVAVDHRLTVSELFFGLKIDQDGHSRRLLTRPKEVIHCIVACCPELAIDEARQEVFLAEVAAPSPPKGELTIRQKVIKKFLTAESRMIHKLDLFDWAINQGLKPHTAQHTWRYDSRLRSRGDIVYLVGNNFDEELADVLESAARVRYSRSPYFEFAHETGRGGLQLNPLWISSGNIFVPADFGQLFPVSMRIACTINGCNSAYSAGRTQNGNAVRPEVGLAAHLIQAHQVRSMSWVKFLASPEGPVLTEISN